MSGRIHVLHVDDEPDVVDLTAEFLERESDRIEVTGVTRPEAALSKLRESDVHCVVSDYQMPGTDGLELLREVREVVPDIPFILFTGRGSEEIASEAISAGVTEYLQKGGPDRYTVLANRIEQAVDKYRAERAVERSEARLRKVIDLIPHTVFVTDEEGTYLLSNEANADLHGLTVEEIEGTNAREVLAEEEFENYHRDAKRVLETGEQLYVPGARITDAAGDTRIMDARLIPFDFPEAEERAVLGVAIDVTERERWAQQLEALHEGTRRLMGARNREAVAEITAEVATEALDYETNVVRLLEEGRYLEPYAVTDEARDELGERPVYEVGEGPPGMAFERGESCVYDDVGEIEDEYDRGEAKAGMYLPIGEYGTLSVADTSAGSFSESDVRIASILVANAEAALRRLEREG